MSKRRVIYMTCLLLPCVVFSSVSKAPSIKSATMKMTTEVPEGLATPDKLETRIGTLK